MYGALMPGRTICIRPADYIADVVAVPLPVGRICETPICAEHAWVVRDGGLPRILDDETNIETAPAPCVGLQTYTAAAVPPYGFSIAVYQVAIRGHPVSPFCENEAWLR